MRVVRRSCLLALIITIIALTGLLVPPGQSSAATQRTLAWSVVDTPADGINGMFIRTCGINDLALGPDSRTFYAVSTDNSMPNTVGLFKSTDGGYTWSSSIGNSLATAAVVPVPLVWYLPVWNIAVAPDDANFIIAVTDNSRTAASGGPGMAYCSIDGGTNWVNTGLTLNPNEYISCLDISTSNAGNRDIAVGTRSIGDTQGRLLTVRYSTTFSGGWAIRNPPDLPNPTTAITSLKFSPNYIVDQALAVISFTAAGAALHIGKYDIPPNPIQWDITGGYTAYPVSLGAYPAGNIIRTGIALPSDYTVGTDMSLSGCFVNLLNTASSPVFYISTAATMYDITLTLGRIYSIAYSGTNATGILLAGAANAYSATALADVWQCSNAQATTPGAAYWVIQTGWKKPTGGGGTGLANVLLAWSAGGIAYCGTSSENSILGGTGWAVGQWPFSKLTKVPSDESAFQYSLDNGPTWNQIGIINTIISRLSDVAAVEKPEDLNVLANGTLYLASLNTSSVTPNIDSVWRSTSDPLGRLWERTFTLPSSDSGTILRLVPSDPAADTMSSVVVFADLGTRNIFYSGDSGNTWTNVGIATNVKATSVKDISLRDGSTMYVLNDYQVNRIIQSGDSWKSDKTLNTNMLAPGHTVCNPLSGSSTNELVFVGSEGNTDTAVAWADFSAVIPQFTLLKEPPMQGNVHVIADDQYDDYNNIYAGINDVITNADGAIFRWNMAASIAGEDPMETITNWDPLEPPDRGFYGLCMLNDVLYGAWNTDIEPPINSSGADRTLEARVRVPPPPQWDQLIDGLPEPGSPNQVEFTREPTSMHISSNTYNTLWAIDNQDYAFTLKKGCLWQFVDSVAKLSPWPTAPALGSFIGADPVTGRSQQIDFKWRPLKDIFGYDVLIAKDVNFTLLLSQNVNMTPVDNETGAWIVTPADQNEPSCWISPGVLEVGRPYYWRVRASRSIEGTPIHSPWSQALFFSVKPGFKVTSEYLGPKLLAPVDGVCSNCKPPIRFSWSPVKNARVYEFILARDAQLKDIIVLDWTGTTSYDLNNSLPISTPYYWRVKAISPVISEPSPVGTFALSEPRPTTYTNMLPAINTSTFPVLSSLWIGIVIVVACVLMLLIGAYVFISRRRY